MVSLLTFERKLNNYSNPFRIRIFLFLSYSSGIETISTFIHSRSSLENRTRFQTKMGKVFSRFQTKTRKNPTRWGGTYLHGLYKEVPPPSPGRYCCCNYCYYCSYKLCTAATVCYICFHLAATTTYYYYCYRYFCSSDY